MNSYAILGLVLGGVSLLVYISNCARTRTHPQIDIALQLLIAGISASGGIKICLSVFLTQFRDAIGKVPNMSPDDTVYFFLGGFALFWFSAQTLGRGLLTSRKKVNEPQKI